VALPEPPDGLIWEVRGFGWESKGRTIFATIARSYPRWKVWNDHVCHPKDNVFVIEAVRDEISGRISPGSSEIQDDRENLEQFRIKNVDEVRGNSAIGLLTEASTTIGARASERDVESERSMAKCVAAFNAMFGTALTEEQGWQFMVLLKMSRSTVGRKRDDYVDGAAYFALAGECTLNSPAAEIPPVE